MRRIHIGGSRRCVIIKCLDTERAIAHLGKPRLRRTVMGRHTDHTRIHPLPACRLAHKRQARMPSNHTIEGACHGFQRRPLRLEHLRCICLPDKARNIAHPAVQNPVPFAVMDKAQRIGQARHPRPVRRAKLRLRERIPRNAETVTGRSLLKAATAISSTLGQLHLAIACQYCTARRAHRRNARQRRTAIGDNITGADHMISRNAPQARLRQYRLRGLQIAVRPAKQQHISVQHAQITMFHVHASLIAAGHNPITGPVTQGRFPTWICHRQR
ncbi:hypothetical protein Z949_1424 [Sulfitobacter guttiformis KCTC 32187]|nr:hypothetical protein Z949_1424 [Sulfitobacter guttiformis KCTC 32187]